MFGNRVKVIDPSIDPSLSPKLPLGLAMEIPVSYVLTEVEREKTIGNSILHCAGAITKTAAAGSGR